MRRSILTAALLIVVTALPVCAQRRGVSSPRAGASVGTRSSGRVIVNGGVGFGVRGGVGFGRNPGFGVFVNRRPIHPRRFYNPYVYAYPYSIYPYTAYPYYGVGLQSDFVYSNAAVGTYSSPAYMADHDTGVQSDLYRLQAELDQVRQQQAADRQQYALSTPTDTPRPIPATRPRPEPPAPPTVLIFRDGHQSEVHNYAVVGQVLWIFSEERARKVSLADLDLDATRKANEERGVDFAVQPKPPSQ